MRFVLIPVLAAALGLAACGGPDGDGGGDAVRVVASFYPLAEAAERVGGGKVEVTNLTPVGTEPHDLELDPRQVGEVQDADVVLVLGHGFQPAVEDVAGSDAVVVLDENDRGGDAHVWLDPARMAGIVDDVTAALAEADPDGAAGYEANAAAYKAELADLDADFEAGLADCERDTIVVSHEAFGSLAERYGLRQEGISGISPDAEPDPRRIAELAALVEADGITTVFTETLVSPDVAEALARDAGVQTAVLDPVEGLSDESAGDDYASVMRANLDVLRVALGCS
jgi:zinc transport system substrate-binding protein